VSEISIVLYKNHFESDERTLRGWQKDGQTNVTYCPYICKTNVQFLFTGSW